MYLYEVRYNGDTSDENWRRFFENVTDLGAIATDRLGITNLCALTSSQNAVMVKNLCASGLKPQSAKNKVVVVEITAVTVADPQHSHSAYQNVVDWAKPNGIFPNL